MAGATVTFATSPPDVFDTFSPARVVEATTDDAGKFRVLLRPGAAHSAWAIGPASDAGRLRTAVTEGVVAGSVLEFRAECRSVMPRLRVTELSRLGSGPFTASVRGSSLHGPSFLLPLAADGGAELPELPEGQAIVRL